MRKILIGLLACLCVGLSIIGFSGCDFGGSTGNGTLTKEEEELQDLLCYRLNEDEQSYAVSMWDLWTEEDFKNLSDEQEEAIFERMMLVAKYSATLVIPNEHNGLSVTSIGYGAFGELVGLKSIEIPDSVTSSGKKAFYGGIG